MSATKAAVPHVGQNIGIPLAEALGIPTNGLIGFTLRCYSDEIVTIDAEYQADESSINYGTPNLIKKLGLVTKEYIDLPLPDGMSYVAEAQRKDAMNEIKEDSVGRLKSGGPAMCVENVGLDGTIMCSWIDDQSTHADRCTYAPTAVHACT